MSTPFDTKAVTYDLRDPVAADNCTGIGVSTHHTNPVGPLEVRKPRLERPYTAIRKGTKLEGSGRQSDPQIKPKLNHCA